MERIATLVLKNCEFKALGDCFGCETGAVSILEKGLILKAAFGDFGLDVGGIYYAYPGSVAAATGKAVKNGELYIGGSWKFLSLKYSHAVTDYFSAPDTKGTTYWDLSAAYDLGEGWGVNGHLDRSNVKNSTVADYTDWKVGVTKDLSGWVVGLSYVGTNADEAVYTWTKTTSGKTIDAGKNTAVLSVSKTF